MQEINIIENIDTLPLKEQYNLIKKQIAILQAESKKRDYYTFEERLIIIQSIDGCIVHRNWVFQRMQTILNTFSIN